MHSPPLYPFDLIVVNRRELLQQEALLKTPHMLLDDRSAVIVLCSPYHDDTVPPPNHRILVVLLTQFPVELLNEVSDDAFSGLNKLMLSLTGVLQVVLGEENHGVTKAYVTYHLTGLLSRHVSKENVPVAVPRLGPGASYLQRA